MSRLKHYIAVNIFLAIGAVLFVIVALDVIFQLIEQLGRLKGEYGVDDALIYSALKIPATVYEYLGLASLVGCLVGLGSLASSSELVVMRAAGVSMRQLIWAVFRPVILLTTLGFFIGEYVSPYTDQYADSRKAIAQGHTQSLESERGLWNREGNEFMHFNAVLPNGKLYGVTRFILDEQNQINEVSFVDSAIFQGDYWFEQDGVVTRFYNDRIEKTDFTSRRWHTDVNPELLNVLVLSPDNLPLKRLYNYSSYLDKQNLESSDYWLAFWQKTLQPFATFSLVVIAISFILGPLRQVTMGFRVFIGILVGLMFQTTQKLLGPASIVWGFSPFVAVFIPIFLSFLIGVFVIRRAE